MLPRFQQLCLLKQPLLCGFLARFLWTEILGDVHSAVPHVPRTTPHTANIASNGLSQVDLTGIKLAVFKGYPVVGCFAWVERLIDFVVGIFEQPAVAPPVDTGQIVLVFRVPPQGNDLKSYRWRKTNGNVARIHRIVVDDPFVLMSRATREADIAIVGNFCAMMRAPVFHN